MNDEKLATALGWFSVGLGLAELATGGRMSRSLGMDDRAWLVRGFGAREIATGAGILLSPAEPGWLWARVGGDLLDLAALGAAIARPGNPRRGRAVVAAVAVAGVTVLDVLAALWLARSRERRHRTARRTRVRSTAVERPWAPTKRLPSPPAVGPKPTRATNRTTKGTQRRDGQAQAS
jgi:hypothetical protein